MKEFTIGKNEAGQRLDKYLKKIMPDAKSNFLYKMLRKKNIVWNGKKASGAEKLSVGDSVKIYFSDETFELFSNSNKNTVMLPDAQKMPDIIYEDEDMILLNKPAGMLSQKAKAHDISANEYLISYLLKKGEVSDASLASFRPAVCNRLDRNTSGILTAGKSLKGLQELSEMLKKRTVQKYYRCIVAGHVQRPAHIEGFLRKDEKTNRVSVYEKEVDGSKYMETSYQPIWTDGEKTLLEVHLITGRSHQIRAHLSSVGYPIIGDIKYGDAKVNEKWKRKCGINSQMLHAYRMEFPDGRSFTAPLPFEFHRVMAEKGKVIT